MLVATVTSAEEAGDVCEYRPVGRAGGYVRGRFVRGIGCRDLVHAKRMHRRRVRHEADEGAWGGRRLADARPRLLVVVGMAGLVIRARHAGRFGALGKTGAVVAAVGAALPMIGGLIQGIVYGGDYPWCLTSSSPACSWG